jgi:UDP:flavonoid glycosyltransferase YjiC (YdhE family)
MYDVLIVSDFRFPGGTSAAIASEIKALSKAGYRVGLLQVNADVLKQARPINREIADLLEDDAAELCDCDVVRRIETKLAVLHNPYVFTSLPARPFPQVRAAKKILVAHQPLLDGNGVPYFDAALVNHNAETLVGSGILWAPISPVSRENLLASNIPFPILDDDWTNLIFVDEWGTDRVGVHGAVPIIGRHSRPKWEKWPATKEELLTIYPDSDQFEVRLLGVGDGLKTLLAGEYPANWQTYEFNEISPLEFLASIDFFVYYHHPAWVEAFGRTIAEAAASGAVLILPNHFRKTFGEAALYREPSEVLDTLRALHKDPVRFQLQSTMGRHIVDRMYGPERYLERIKSLIGSVSNVPWANTDRKTKAADDVASYDVAMIGDFRSCDEAAWRISQETRIQADNGYSTALVHQATKTGGDLPYIHPEIQALVDEGLAAPIHPETSAVRVKLFTIHQPMVLFDRIDDLDYIAGPRIIADAVVAVLDRLERAAKIHKKDALLKTFFGGNLTWCGATADIREHLRAAGGITVADEIWSLSLSFRPWISPKPQAGRKPVVGWIRHGGKGEWPDAQMLEQSLPVSTGVSSRLFCMVDSQDLPEQHLLGSRETFTIRDMSPTRFVGTLDFLSYFPGRKPKDLPVHAIAHAMCRGVPAMLSAKLEPAFGRGPNYMNPKDVETFVEETFRDPSLYEQFAMEQAREARKTYGPAVHEARLRRFVGTADDRKASTRPEPKRRRVLFFSSNGVGMGHLTRLLAVARRMGPDHEPVFLTMSQALPIVEQAGYPVEYLPFHIYANVDQKNWNLWLREQLEQILDFHNPAAVVFDGGNPYAGLIDAILPRDIRLIWIRRAMWREEQNNDSAIYRQRFFDLVIEPMDIAESRDRGATTHNQVTTLRVPPIRLLDEHEILSRAEACERIGLDPSKPAVLIQLGSGSNRDIVSIIDAVLNRLSKNPDFQPVLAEWMIAPKSLDLWPGARRLRGFPLSRYFNAFDFTISAAGYNSFNEIISFALPAIFMANSHATMDDQDGRAAFAQDNQAAFHIPELESQKVEPLIDLMLDPELQSIMRSNCSRLAMENGAERAAAAIRHIC